MRLKSARISVFNNWEGHLKLQIRIGNSCVVKKQQSYKCKIYLKLSLLQDVMALFTVYLVPFKFGIESNEDHHR